MSIGDRRRSRDSLDVRHSFQSIRGRSKNCLSVVSLIRNIQTGEGRAEKERKEENEGKEEKEGRKNKETEEEWKDDKASKKKRMESRLTRRKEK